MKDKLIFTAMLFGLFGCTLEVNEVNPQVSDSIEESKKNSFFISEYTAIQQPKGMFEIVEVWQERIWYNKVASLFRKTKVVSDSNESWILIKTKETPQSQYVYSNYSSEWQLSESGNLTYSVGYVGGLLTASLKKTGSSPDTIRLVLSKGQLEIGEITLCKNKNK